MIVDRLLDTDFLIARWQGGEESDASRWLEANSGLRLGIPWVVKGEFLRAAEMAGQETAAVRRILSRYPTHWPDDDLVSTYASIASAFPDQPTNWCWIAASAVRSRVPIVSRRLGVFREIEGFVAEAF